MSKLVWEETPGFLWEPRGLQSGISSDSPRDPAWPLQLGQVRLLSASLGHLVRVGRGLPGQQPTQEVLSRVRWTPQPLSSLLAPFPQCWDRVLVQAQQMVEGWGVGGAPRTSGRALCGPQPARSSLHHIGNEVELVPWAGQLVETCTGRKNQVH